MVVLRYSIDDLYWIGVVLQYLNDPSIVDNTGDGGASKKAHSACHNKLAKKKAAEFYIYYHANKKNQIVVPEGLEPSTLTYTQMTSRISITI